MWYCTDAAVLGMEAKPSVELKESYQGRSENRELLSTGVNVSN